MVTTTNTNTSLNTEILKTDNTPLSVPSYFAKSSAAPPVPNSNTVLGAVGEFIGGGSADLVFRNTSTGATEIWEMDGQYMELMHNEIK